MEQKENTTPATETNSTQVSRPSAAEKKKEVKKNRIKSMISKLLMMNPAKRSDLQSFEI